MDFRSLRYSCTHSPIPGLWIYGCTYDKDHRFLVGSRSPRVGRVTLRGVLYSGGTSSLRMDDTTVNKVRRPSL